MKLNTSSFLPIILGIFLYSSCLKAINIPETDSLALNSTLFKIEKLLQETEKSVGFTKIKEVEQAKRLIKIYGDKLKKIVKKDASIALDQKTNAETMHQWTVHLKQKNRLRKTIQIASWLIPIGILCLTYKAVSPISSLIWGLPIIGGNSWILKIFKATIALAMAGTAKKLISLIIRKNFPKDLSEKFLPQVVKTTQFHLHHMYKYWLMNDR